MHLFQKLKTFFEYVIAFLNLSKKDNETHSLSIWEIINFEKCGYLSAQ